MDIICGHQRKGFFVVCLHTVNREEMISKRERRQDREESQYSLGAGPWRQREQAEPGLPRTPGEFGMDAGLLSSHEKREIIFS